MLYCEPCGAARGWSLQGFHAIGACELCSKVETCIDTNDNVWPSAEENRSEFSGRFTSTGRHESRSEPNDNGTDISLFRQGSEWPWVDLMELHYHPFSAEEKAALEPDNSLRNGPHTVAHRRLGRAQALFLCDEIVNFLNERFANGLPDEGNLPNKYKRFIVKD